MNLVEDWKDCWKWFSTRAMVIAGALQTTWLTMPEEFKADVPPTLVHWLTVAILIAGVIGRVVKQKETASPKAELDRIGEAIDDVTKEMK